MLRKAFLFWRLNPGKAKKMENDIRIVSSAAIAGLSKIITINRKTMAADKIVEIYKSVNSSKKLKTPEFIFSKSAAFWNLGEAKLLPRYNICY